MGGIDCPGEDPRQLLTPSMRQPPHCKNELEPPSNGEVVKTDLRYYPARLSAGAQKRALTFRFRGSPVYE